MKNGVKYSVIIPAYNRESTLPRCLDSLLAQPRSDVQIIVVDDGSTDGTGQILRGYAEKYPAVQYLYKENGGVSSARNLGLDHARGKYVSFVDSDDYVLEDYFMVLDRWTANEDSDMLVFRKNGCGGPCPEEAHWFEQLAVMDPSQRLRFLLASRLIMHPVNKCLKNEIIQREHIRFVEDFHIGEDFTFCMDYAMFCARIDIEQSVLYYYDVSDQNSLSRKYRPMLNVQMRNVYARISRMVAASSQPEKQKSDLLALLDYLYIKNVFSSIAEEFKRGCFGYFRHRAAYAEICESFSQPLSDRRCNAIHRCLRLLMQWRIYWPFYFVTYLVKGRRFGK